MTTTASQVDQENDYIRLLSTYYVQSREFRRNRATNHVSLPPPHCRVEAKEVE